MFLVLITDSILQLDTKEASLFLWYICTRKIAKSVYIERVIVNSDWIIYIILTCIVLLAILRARFPYRFQSFLQLTYQSNFIKQYNRSVDQRHLFTFLSTFFNLISTSLFLFICAQQFLPTYEIEGIGWYIRIATLYSIFVLGKLWIEQIVGVITKRQNEISNYAYEKLIYRNLLSVFILICNILLLYTIPKTQMSLTIVGVTILFLNLIGLLSIHKRNSSQLFGRYFYFILYLCALEIGPYILIIYTLIGL